MASLSTTRELDGYMIVTIDGVKHRLSPTECAKLALALTVDLPDELQGIGAKAKKAVKAK